MVDHIHIRTDKFPLALLHQGKGTDRYLIKKVKMKRTLFLLCVIVVLTHLATALAQNPVTVIDTLGIEIWPDYDRPSVLVLLTGTLPEDTPLPASVTLPLPEGARINAVARIDGNDGKMKDDIFSSTDTPGTLTLVTPDLRFRVEYYLPYRVNNGQRSFDYTWLAAVSVNNFILSVQRPLSASTLVTEPAAETITRSGDGFDYHTFSGRAVPAGQGFSVQVEYSLTTDQLSVTNLPPLNTDTQTDASAVDPATDSGLNWALVAIIVGGFLIFGALIWQVASRRTAASTRNTGDLQGKKQSQAKFCPNCGEPIEKGDRFCRGCGSKL